jgi:hypothetical protein
MEVLLVANCVFSLCGVIGSIIWAVEDDIYTLTSIYGFYWFVSVSSLVSGLFGYFVHKTSLFRNINTNLFNAKEYGIYAMFFYSFIMTLFWICASASVARVTRDCLYIKNKYSSIVDYYYSKLTFTCNGEIVTMTFGFASFIVWCIVTFLVGKKLYSHFMSKVDEQTIELSEMQSEQPLEKVETHHEEQRIVEN